MKKKIISICFCLVIVLIGTILAIYNNSFSKYVVIDGIHYAVNTKLMLLVKALKANGYMMNGSYKLLI